MRGKASEQTFSLDIEPPPVSKSFFLWLLTFVVGLFGLFAAGSHLFAGGFLLNRLELDSVSPCDMPLPTGDLTTDPLSTYKGNSTACWHPPRFKRSLLIIIDALRFDFMEHRPDILNDDAPHYINKMPLFNQIISSNNSTSQRGHGLLCRARADPPTTTLQRIKALMTGNLPTVVDAGSNFASSKVSEDSLLSQWTSNGVTAAMVGDDTWVRLFPSSFTHSAVPFESFDVWDLHTVDNGVIDHLFPLLDRNRNATLQKWGFAVGHFLGVDHVGHRFGPSHPEMGLKLSQMNGVLQRVFDAVDEETVVYVMGDHGMDAKGDHGGDSEDELNSGLFVYSKTPLLEKDETWDRIMARLESLNFGTDEPLVTQFNARTFPQIDLVPTAALLTGIPIPFGNLGTIIPELFYTSSTSTTLSPLQNLVRVSRLNAHQIHRYMAEYTSKRAWASDALKDLESLYQEAERLYLTFRDSTHSTDATTQRDIDTYIAYTLYTKKVLVQARRIWSRFDVSLIIMGIVVLTLTVLCLIATISQGPGLLYTHGPISLGTGLVSSLGSVVLRPVQTVLSVSEDSVMMAHHEALFMFLVGGLGMLLIRAVISGFSSLASFDVTSVRKVWSNNVCLGLLLSLMYIAAPGSDSFTIWEDHLTVYLLQTFGVYNLIMAVSVKESEARWEIVRNS